MNTTAYHTILTELKPFNAQLVAVSKTKPVADVLEMYQAGQRVFGENKVQEMVEKYEALPKDIEWHLIGHLQTNKVKYIAPFVSLIHSVDSLKLLQEIDKQALRSSRVIDCLLQIYIANEDTKFGLDKQEAIALLQSAEYKALKNIRICGLMGMASNTNSETQIEKEFKSLKQFFEELKLTHFNNAHHFKEISMGMSGDYKLALKHGATLIRVGSLLFGSR
jgi:pyridoxal phosphate enzyme (YggS family)